MVGLGIGTDPQGAASLRRHAGLSPRKAGNRTVRAAQRIQTRRTATAREPRGPGAGRAPRRDRRRGELPHRSSRAGPARARQELQGPPARPPARARARSRRRRLSPQRSRGRGPARLLPGATRRCRAVWRRNQCGRRRRAGSGLATRRRDDRPGLAQSRDGDRRGLANGDGRGGNLRPRTRIAVGRTGLHAGPLSPVVRVLHARRLDRDSLEWPKLAGLRRHRKTCRKRPRGDASGDRRNAARPPPRRRS